jgi:ABC-2 type transport system ATP-binding protein
MLELDGLTRRYGETLALDELSLTVRPGTLCGFVGPNGAGKTTTMRIVLGVLSPDAGTVCFGGQPVDRDMRTRFGYMPEERGLYPRMPVAEQLEHLARLHGRSAAEAREKAATLLERLGISARAKDKTEELSLGNQQRVQLAAALVHDPELLVLDEPFSGLDPVGVDVLADVLLERVRDGVPVLFSSHQLELVERLCDDVAIIKAGRLVAAGEVKELRRQGGRRIAAEVDGAKPGWADGLDGVEATDDAHTFALAEGADEQLLLDAARRSGRVVRFAPAERSLVELFRAVISE